MSGRGKGNNPEAWEKLIQYLDERLQLGLLDKLRKATAYHLEGEQLTLYVTTKEDYAYLTKPAVNQQLQILVEDCLAVKEVILIDTLP